MFLDRNLKDIQAAKDRLALCCELRRRLIYIEVQGLYSGVRRTCSSVSLGLAVVEQILTFLRARKDRRR